jgi:hypothetical protein
VLEDVWHAGGIWWVGLEANGEHVVRILAGDVQVLGASLVMLQVQCRKLELWHLLDALERKTVKLLARLREVVDIGDCGISALRDGRQAVGGRYRGMSRVSKLPTGGAQHVWDEGVDASRDQNVKHQHSMMP